MKQQTIKNCLVIFLMMCFGQYAALGQENEEEESNKPKPIPIAKDVTVTYLASNTWLWTAYQKPDGNPPMINGLLTVTDSMVIGINTPWRASQVDTLTKFCLEKLQRRMNKVVLTGFFPIREKAVARYQTLGVSLLGTLNYRTLASTRQMTIPSDVFTRTKNIEVDGRLFNIYSPGPVLGKDNVIIYIPHDEILFLGPLIKAPRVTLPKIPGPRLDSWQNALQQSQLKFPDSKMIIASRGPVRDKQAVAQTYVVINRARQP